MYSLLSLSMIFIATLKAQVPQTQGQVNNPSGNVGVTPGNPNIQPVTPINPVPPVTGQQPPAGPQFGPFGGLMPGLMDPKVLMCEFGQCRNRKITMTPGQGFKLDCKMMRQCDGLDLTLNIGHDPTSFGSAVTDINDFNFEAPQNGVKITMNNMFPGNMIEVNNINCKVFGACQNMRVTAGFGVELWEINMKCEVPGACTGCTINGQSCEMVSMMTGSHHGGMMPGFGYMNTPNMPGAPQPGFGAPQQPSFGAPQYPQYQQQGQPGFGAPQSQYQQQPLFQPIYPAWI